MSHFSNHQKIKEWKNREFKRKIETLQSRKKRKKLQILKMSQKFTIWAESLILAGISNAMIFGISISSVPENIGKADDMASEFQKNFIYFYSLFLKLQIC